MFYHVWFKAKWRKWLLLGDVEQLVKTTMQEIAMQYQIPLLECETMVDHVHLLLEVKDRQQLSKAMHLLKGASARAVLQSFPELRMDAQIDHFWQKRYGAKPVEPAALAHVSHYIRTQKERSEKYAR